MKLAQSAIYGFQQILERSETELMQAVKKHSSAGGAVERERLRLVQAALQRIHDGKFGVCLGCGTTIGPRRLLEMPWMPICLECELLPTPGLK